ncbi:sulfite exporter TauE/SafE family protein [Ilumatobacter nonamiensis]|uniref:sulfite exporter TauE/SafE family protein n=1 Tax=Ilumatobacter nonamiensis TaxID=467093 RepID=UPI00034B0E1F|nr:sulfite exporter TauE/SafE family protein [Ilumatobacter nonamiensis]
MTFWEAVLLLVGGLAAGVINTMAGGGSALTVPLLVLAGVPGNQANGSNRVGVLTSSAAAVAAFRGEGVDGLKGSQRILVPAVIGSLIGAFGISQVADETFETIFGYLLIPIIILTIFKPKPAPDATPWSPPVTMGVFFLIGCYGGAFQAGVGLVMLAALTRAGYDLVTANSVKVLVNLIVTVIALPVFVLQGNVVWAPALVLAAGFMGGGWFGAKLAVKGGEKLVRVFMIGAALYLAGRLIGIW